MVREPIVAGILYPSEPMRLRRMVQRLIMESPVISGNALALILPYGHYESVGPLIAAGMKRVAASVPKRVLLLASPTSGVPAGIFIPKVSAFATPLGTIPVDTDALTRLVEGGAEADDLLHLQEHVLELHLPFLAHLFPSVPILPVLAQIGDTTELQRGTDLIRSLGEEFLSETLVIVSSNSSSFTEIRHAGWESRRLIGAALTHNVSPLLNRYRASLITGAGPIALLCNLLPAEVRATLLGRSRHHTYEDGATFAIEYASIVFDLPQ
ncbi:MAG: AmmeMemoRadiSam system protein B [Alkalispirochaetaceae bacterium]